uniref:Uncharacterized protein n=1 Tax=Lepeophtheirus salmonis TaxID=72036 RepID=A0A0K2VF84_LEPSM
MNTSVTPGLFVFLIQNYLLPLLFLIIIIKVIIGQLYLSSQKNYPSIIFPGHQSSVLLTPQTLIIKYHLNN